MKTDNIKALIEKLTWEMLAVNEFADKVEKDYKSGMELAMFNEERKKQLELKEKQIKEEELRVKENLDLTTKNMKEINLSSIKLEEIKIRLKKERTDLDLKREEIEDKITKLNKKIEEYSTFAEKEKELLTRESLVTKERLIDNKRKEVLDMREKQQGDETVRLQRIASSLGVNHN